MIAAAKDNRVSEAPKQKILALSKILRSRVVGQEDAVHGALTCLLAGGHILLEGPPGVGKTFLAQTLANLFQGSFRRVQMTSDLMPSDILGSLRVRPGGGDFDFRPGPIFSNVLLADELNRTSAKTQAALLEAMAEGRVTVDGKTHLLPQPFFVVATQNPQEFHGVYPLSESQLDRFMMQICLGLPEAQAELALYRGYANTEQEKTADTLFLTPDELVFYRSEVAKVFVEETLLIYAHEIAQGLRKLEDIVHAASVRAMLQLIDAAKAQAYLAGRDFVLPSDIATLAPAVLAHRLCFRTGEISSLQRKEIVSDAVNKVDSPR